MFGRYREGGFDFEGRSRGGREYARDVRWLGETDKGVTELMKLCGWGVGCIDHLLLHPCFLLTHDCLFS